MSTSEQISLTDLVPGEWKDLDEKFHLMQSVYQCLFFSPAQHNKGYITGRIGDVFYFIMDLAEGLEYYGYAAEWSAIGNEAHVSAQPYSKITPKGVHLILFTPCKPDGGVSEADALFNIESAVGLINALEGKNASLVYRFRQLIVFPNGTTESASPAELSPSTYPKPFHNPNRVPEVAKKIFTAEPILRSRIQLALRWFDQSERESDFIDAFLKAWFALEILAMPDGTNISQINNTLSEIYKKSHEETKVYFQIGKVFGLRSKIVHEGHIPSIHYQLQRYVQAIFVDVLLHLIDSPSEKRSELVLKDTSVEYSAWRPY